jgi:hypothetical protein
MYILSIPGNKATGQGNKDHVDELIKNKKHVFILVYMEGCGPCNATRPEWAKMCSALKDQYASNKDVAIIDMNKDNLSSVKHLGSVEGFPTMKYITNNGNTIEAYEDSSIKNKDRSSDSFVNWIESKILEGKMVSDKPSSSHHVYKRIRKNHSKSKSHSDSKGKSRKTKKRKVVRKSKSRRIKK